jgi:DNA-directed RNA polymerase specialized sigma24 family protein
MRQCFLFRFQQGRKYKDIAQIMQISIQSVKSQLHQAKHRLRQILEGPEDPPN